jgi:hypothetical protein
MNQLVINQALGRTSLDQIRLMFNGMNPEHYDDILFPINFDNLHWALINVSPTANTITYFDGLAHDASLHLQILYDLFSTLRSASSQPPLQLPIPFRIQIAPVPNQPNGYDCGIFVIINAECATLGYDYTATLTDFSSTHQRRRLALLLAPSPSDPPPQYQFPRQPTRSLTPPSSPVFGRNSSFAPLLDQVTDLRSPDFPANFSTRRSYQRSKRKEIQSSLSDGSEDSATEDLPSFHRSKRNKRHSERKRDRFPATSPLQDASSSSFTFPPTDLTIITEPFLPRKRRVIIDEESTTSLSSSRPHKTKRIEVQSEDDSPQRKRPCPAHDTDDPG